MSSSLTSIDLQTDMLSRSSDDSIIEEEYLPPEELPSKALSEVYQEKVNLEKDLAPEEKARIYKIVYSSIEAGREKTTIIGPDNSGLTIHYAKAIVNYLENEHRLDCKMVTPNEHRDQRYEIGPAQTNLDYLWIGLNTVKYLYSVGKSYVLNPSLFSENAGVYVVVNLSSRLPKAK